MPAQADIERQKKRAQDSKNETIRRLTVALVAEKAKKAPRRSSKKG